MRILFERKYKKQKHDDWALSEDKGYCLHLYFRLVWNKGFFWGIGTDDFSLYDKSLSRCIFRALDAMDSDSPKYSRTEDRIMRRGIWKYM